MNDYQSTIDGVKSRLDQPDELFHKTSRADMAKLMDIITFLEFENERLNIKLEELEDEIKSKITEIDKRIERRNGTNFHDETAKIDSLHGEALVYEKVLKMLEKY